MNFLVFSDLHIHNYKKFDDNGSRLLNCLKVLVDVFQYAEQNSIDHILFCGDLFDQQKSLPTEVINKTLELFKELFETYGHIHFVSITGNHDQSSKNTLEHNSITALSCLDEMFNNFHLIDDKTYEINGVNIMGIPYYSHKEHFKQMIPHPGIMPNILMIHQTPKHSNEMIPFDCEAEDFKHFDFVFCGHIHKHERLSENFVIVGSPLHRDLGDEGQEKGFLIYDSEVNDFLKINLDYPKFERVNPEDSPTSIDNYIIPIIEEVEEKQTEISLNDSHLEMLKKFVEVHGKSEDYLEIGKNLLL